MRSNLKILFSFGCISWMLCACGQTKSGRQNSEIETANVSLVQKTGNTVETRFQLPEDFERTPANGISFGSYLRNLPLKSAGEEVTYFNGTKKPSSHIYDAVVDLPIGKRDLHQCADAVMRLRAAYLFQEKKYDSIHFNFTNGFKADYANWRRGKRIAVNGNTVTWKQTAQPSNDLKSFWKYLEMVFSYAGTASLEKEMKSISLEEIHIGDVFIKGGFPGHAVIVVDMAVHKATKEKVFLLAQSYMPAQEIQILKNPNNRELSPWYLASEITEELRTPEWTFKKSALRRF